MLLCTRRLFCVQCALFRRNSVIRSHAVYKRFHFPGPRKIQRTSLNVTVSIFSPYTLAQCLLTTPLLCSCRLLILITFTKVIVLCFVGCLIFITTLWRINCTVHQIQFQFAVLYNTYYSKTCQMNCTCTIIQDTKTFPKCYVGRNGKQNQQKLLVQVCGSLKTQRNQGCHVRLNVHTNQILAHTFSHGTLDFVVP